MFKFRRFVSSLVASSMALTIAATTAFAAIPNDVAGTKYEEAAEVLGVLGIMVGDKDEGTFRPDDAIIRSEVTKVGVASLGLLGVAETSNGPTKFPDVVENHWANGFINVASNQNLIIGDDDGSFRPDEQITYAEAVTILVRALGYEPRAQAKGGFPTGYLVTASDIGLTKNVSGSADQPISRGDVAQLAFNALTINLMEQVGFGSDINYEVVDKTLLEDKLDVTKVLGQVTAVGSSTITGDSNLNDDEIKIGDTVYKTGKADVREILGFNVAAYVQEDPSTGDMVLLLARPEANKNNVVRVAADNIAEIVNEDDQKELHYWVNEETDKKPTKATIETDAKVMYNGKTGSFEDFKDIASGSITLLDSEDNGKYNVVFVNETTNHVVDEVIASSYKVTDKYGQKTLVLDPEDKNLSFTIEKGNEFIGIEDLQEWDVLTMTKSKDEELIHIVVSNESVTGKVTEVDDERVFINGEGYKVAANYTEGVKLEDEGTFYLDAEGKIAAVNTESVVSRNYAYLADIGLSTGLDKVLDIKLFTMDGETQVLKSSERIRVNSQSNLTPEAALTAIQGEGDAAAGQLITFETNSDGDVYRINTASEGEINEDQFVNNMSEDGVVYKAASKKLVGSTMSVNVTNDTIVFDIPEGKTDTKDFSIRKPDFFTNDDQYDVLVFDVKENMNAGVIIVTNATGQASEESPIAVVDKITQTKNEDGMDIEKLYAYQNGELITVNTSETGILVKGDDIRSTTPLQQGDLIQFKTNAKGEIDAITVLFDITTKETEEANTISEDLQTVYGKVVRKFSDSFNLQVNSDAINNYSIGDADIYVVDTTKSKNQVQVGDAGDIQRYDESDPERVFVRIYKDVVQEIVVIR